MAMNLNVGRFVCSLSLVGATVVAIGLSTARAHADCKTPIHGTLGEQVAAGRMYVESTEDCSECFWGFLGSCGWPIGCATWIDTYYVIGSDIRVGSTADIIENEEAPVTLYELNPGYFSIYPDCTLFGSQSEHDAGQP